MKTLELHYPVTQFLISSVIILLTISILIGQEPPCLFWEYTSFVFPAALGPAT